MHIFCINGKFLSKIRRDLAKTHLFLEQPLTPVLRREKLCVNDLRILHKMPMDSMHAVIFGAPCWIVVTMGNIHMKTS